MSLFNFLHDFVDSNEIILVFFQCFLNLTYWLLYGLMNGYFFFGLLLGMNCNLRLFLGRIVDIWRDFRFWRKFKLDVWRTKFIKFWSGIHLFDLVNFLKNFKFFPFNTFLTNIWPRIGGVWVGRFRVHEKLFYN